MISTAMNEVTPVEIATPEQVREQLARILESSVFRQSRRCARFLEFTVNEVLNGHASSLKERTLAVEVFDRSAQWESGEDTIVRVGAREVRKRLAQYYALPGSLQDSVRIELPLGSYVPEFTRVGDPATSATTQTDPIVRVEPLASRPGKYGRRTILLTAAFVAALTAAIAVWKVVAGASAPSRFETFWAPFFHASVPVVIAVPHPLVYLPGLRVYSLDATLHPESAARQGGRALDVPGKLLTGNDFIPTTEQYLAFGDAEAAASLQVMMAKRDRATHVRFASQVQFSDLRDAPAIAIGAFSNRWTTELTQRLRYRFGFDSNWNTAVVDSKPPARTFTPNADQDYVLICRLKNSPTGNVMVMAGGVTQFGTEAVGRLVTDQDAMNDALAKLAPDWAQKNVELIFRVRVIAGSPAKPELLVTYYW